MLNQGVCTMLNDKNYTDKFKTVIKNRHNEIKYYSFICFYVLFLSRIRTRLMKISLELKILNFEVSNYKIQTTSVNDIACGSKWNSVFSRTKSDIVCLP